MFMTIAQISVQVNVLTNLRMKAAASILSLFLDLDKIRIQWLLHSIIF